MTRLCMAPQNSRTYIRCTVIEWHSFVASFFFEQLAFITSRLLSKVLKLKYGKL
jgi:hypothetical protein